MSAKKNLDRVLTEGFLLSRWQIGCHGSKISNPVRYNLGHSSGENINPPG
jgi:hypothetical protein